MKKLIFILLLFPSIALAQTNITINSGSVNVTYPSQSPNTIFAGPTSGSATNPIFRSLVNADLPISGITAASYGSGTAVPVITFNSAGIATGATTAAITPAGIGAASDTTSVTGTLSLTGGGSLSSDQTLSLVNDASSPGNSQYYGTGTNGVKGYYPLPNPSPLTSAASGRLTLTSGTPVTTSDVTGATTLYYTPYTGNQIAIYDGTSTWTLYPFTELSLSLSGLSANTNYDIFIYNNSGTLTLSSTAWTNDTTRATNIVFQDGVYVQSGATSYRYLGTIHITSTAGECEDSALRRFVWNNSNRVTRYLQNLVATSYWTYSSTTWRQWDASSVNEVEFVLGVAEDAVSAQLNAFTTGSNVAYCSLGLDTTSSPSGMIALVTSVPGSASMLIPYGSTPSLGYHYLAMLERTSGGTMTFYGVSAGDQQNGLVATGRF